MRYGATKYSVHRSDDDRYKILQMAWFESKDDWYRYWDGPEMIELRRRNAGHYQIPLLYVWHEEIVGGRTRARGSARAGARRRAPSPNRK